jgi:site-specific DNA-methyltransferase (adenine-specific)
MPGDFAATSRVLDQTLQLGDCLTVMKAMPAQSVDVVVTSPPYNLNLAYGLYDDSRDDLEYIDWMYAVSAGIKRVMKPCGSFFLNITGSNSRPYMPFELMVRLRELGFHLQNHITWIKSISLDNESRGHFKPIGGRRFMHHNHEHVFHLTLDNNVELDRLSIGIPFQDKSNIARRGHERDLRCRGNTWFIPYSTVKSKAQKFNHPGTFPVELPLWCIYLHGVAAAVVLDPFVGTGTTLVAARLAGAHGVGIEIDPTYIETARQRLEQIGKGATDITLNRTELQELMKQDITAEKDAGWQTSLAGLQRRANKTTGRLTLLASDLEQIQRHACKSVYSDLQNRLMTIFGRRLGPALAGSPALRCIHGHDADAVERGAVD